MIALPIIMTRSLEEPSNEQRVLGITGADTRDESLPDGYLNIVVH